MEALLIVILAALLLWALGTAALVILAALALWKHYRTLFPKKEQPLQTLTPESAETAQKTEEEHQYPLSPEIAETLQLFHGLDIGPREKVN